MLDLGPIITTSDSFVIGAGINAPLRRRHLNIFLTLYHLHCLFPPDRIPKVVYEYPVKLN